MSSIEEAKRVLSIEARSIEQMIERIDDRFALAVDIICECKAKVVVAGIGKSGHIGRKIAATMSSTGTPAFFLHPTEGSHGDLGVIGKDDCLLVISYGGSSQEIQDLLTFASRRGLKIIAMTGNMQSQMAQTATVTLDISVSEEACPLKLAPTSSSTVTLALGDALAMAALKKKGFQQQDFAEFHPGGKLGRRLLTRVKDIMHENGALPVVLEDFNMIEAVNVMTGSEVRGVAAVVSPAGQLIGVLTDGDIRRHLNKNQNPLDSKVKDLMSHQPKTIDSEELAVKALFIMEQFSIQSLFVIDPETKSPQGIIHLQDLIRAQIR
jgi:arabinose-5-phosphate isomerase